MSNSQETVEELPSLPPILSDLSSLLDDRPESFASGNDEIQRAALSATKFIFDHALTTEPQSRPHIVDLLSSLSPTEAPQTRSQAKMNGKRKRTSPPLPQFKETPLSSLHIENVDPEQVWAQLELRAQGICDMLQRALDGTEGTLLEQDDAEGGEEGKSRKKPKFSDLTLEDLEQIGLDAKTLEALAQAEDDEEEDSDDDSDESDTEEEEDDGEDVDLGEDTAELKDPDESEPSHKFLSSPSKKNKASKSSGGVHAELDDGFFDLVSFNAETEEAEAKRVSRGRLGKNIEDEDSESEAESIDYFAPVESTEDSEATESGLLYKEFFDPPALATPKSPPKSKAAKVRFHDQVKIKNIKAKGKQIPVNSTYYWDEEDDGDDDFGEDMMDDGEDLENEDYDVEDDYIENGGHDQNEEDEDESDGEDEDSEEGGGGREAIERSKDDLFDEDEPETDTTTHQKRVSSIQEQIAALEAENIAPKNWTLMGEAHSRARPQNSLLEEDLEFERVMKAVPVVTEDVVHELEERIKARIIDNNFDDVVRRRPLDEKAFLPSRMFQLQDTKSGQSLAEIYEGEYVAAQTGGVAGEDRDGKLKKEHEEIERVWEGISSKLDALCNAHFIPKQPTATIVNVSNTAAATLESALPTTHTVSTMLAPEEILTPSSSNGPRVRSELTSTEKRALRSKERKMRKKTRERLEKSVDKFSKVKGVRRQKEEALKKVVKSGKGVTVVGKKNQDMLVSRGRKKKA